MTSSYAAQINAEPAPVAGPGVSAVAAAAREYAAWGWSFIPIHAPVPGDSYRDGKRPATEGGEWLTYSKQRPADELREFWFGRCLRCNHAHYTAPAYRGAQCLAPQEGGDCSCDVPPPNIGVICGQVSDGLVVIDCDTPETYAALCYQYPELRTSRTVRTGKGYHIYTVANEPVKTTKFHLFGSTHHIKAEGSYVVAPPSMHATGRRYEWVADVPPLTLDLPRLKAALAALGATSPARTADEPNHDRGWAAQLIRDGAKHGERDDSTFKLASHLIRYLPYDTTLAVLELWAQARCAQTPDPWGPSDVEAKLRSAVSYGGGQS